MPSGDVKFLMFYATFIFFLGFAISLSDFTNIEGLESFQGLEPISSGNFLLDIVQGVQKFFFLLTISITVPELQFLAILFGAMTIPLAYILLKALPFT